ncbi:unnamed protein product [Ilex paraguariensis]|uniref:Protein OBERON 4 n=1 Tax=Ilex paraguariensis TaxID=185542 RepID=A0ABC8URE1_9AQUA
MKRLRSSNDLDSLGEKGVCKDLVRREEELPLHRSSPHRSFYYKSENGRKGLSHSSSRYDRIEDDRELSRPLRKRSDYDVDSYERRKNYDRYRDGSDRGVLSSSPRSGPSGYGAHRIHRSDSFSAPRREFPKRFRSERDRSRREGSDSSWRRLGGTKDVEEGTRSGGESGKGSRVASDDTGKVRSPQALREATSPPWSKDSGSEQSKSIDVKKSEDLPVESGNSSEMEEGELEPEPEPEPAAEPVSVFKHVAEDQASVGLNSNQELESKDYAEEKSPFKGKAELNKLCVSEEREEVVPSEAVTPVGRQVDKLPDCQNSPVPETSCNRGVMETTTDSEVGKDEEYARENSGCMEKETNTFAEMSQPSEYEQKKDNGIDLEVKVEDIDMPEASKGSGEGSGAPGGVSSLLVTEELTRNFKDKGKCVALSPTNAIDSANDGLRIERESKGLLACRDNDVGEPSTRGFEFFLTDSIKKPEKVNQSDQNKLKDEKLALELSLSLPNILLPIGSHNTTQAPGSPCHTRSVQSFSSTFLTNSDGFTASMSFSGSQHFTHNPSCSLTHNSFDNNEQSVHSRPLFQGVDWQGLSSNGNQELPIHQILSMSENGIYHQSQASQGISNGQAAQVQNLRDVEKGSSRMPIRLDRQLSIHKHLSGAHSGHQNDVRSASLSVGSRETGSEYGKNKKQLVKERSGGGLCKSNNQDEKERLLAVGTEFVEPIINMIVSEPLHEMTRRFNEMTGQSVACLKESVCEIILSTGKQWQLRAFQKALRSRSDITLEMLLKAHRAQLEILVALKTGLQEFLQQNYDISSSDLAEIFLNLRCRNLSCRNLLPVDECDCKVCAQKNGFCSACMCLVCSKFDMASNTCSWVGCDLCLHWCHADCGLRESYIRNGRSDTGDGVTTEMQFHCVACDHPSEMFGFVKEVFQNFAKEWTRETLSKELEYVRKVFCASEDVRGKQLYEIAIQMLSRLVNKSDLQEVQNHIMGFLMGSDSLKSGNTHLVSVKKQSIKNLGESSNGIAGSSQEAAWVKSMYAEKSPQVEKAANIPTKFDPTQSGIHSLNSDLQRSARKEPVFDELESVVRIKQAEAKMFQARADDARREAEGLKRIATAKNEKIEEEYMSRITKLRLSEAEELRKQKFEELQAIERAHQEYLKMKTRMEADIKDMMLKMEATRRNLSM